MLGKIKLNIKIYNHPQDYHSPGSIEYCNLIVKGFNATVQVNESFEKEFKS
jgi:hypothetical protein